MSVRVAGTYLHRTISSSLIRLCHSAILYETNGVYNAFFYHSLQYLTRNRIGMRQATGDESANIPYAIPTDYTTISPAAYQPAGPKVLLINHSTTSSRAVISDHICVFLMHE